MAKKIIFNIANTNNYLDNIEYIDDRKYNDSRYYICNKKLCNLGWTKQYSFDEGLKETIEWYNDNINYWK